MKRLKTIILVIAILGVLIGVPVTVYLVSQQSEDIRIKAQTTDVTPTTCQAPALPTNVKVEFPGCQGTLCSFTQASCKWDGVVGAVSYNVKITEVDTNTVIKNEPQNSSTTKIIFPVTVGRTYQCDVSAVNSCGATGATGIDSLLCQVEGVLPTITPTPLPNVTSSPTPATAACGLTCSANNPCQSGLVCAQATGGQSYCAMPTLQSACQQSPSVASCCVAPTTIPVPTATPRPRPTVAPPGDGSVILLGASGITLVIVSGLAFFLLSF